MKIDTRGGVALAAILDIAIRGTNKPVRLADISERLCVSVSYLEQLMRELRRHGFVASFHGPGGGYRLSRHLSDISVADIVSAVDGEACDFNPLTANNRGKGPIACVTDGLWNRVSDQMQDYLRSVTLEAVLADVSESADVRGTSAGSARTSGVATAPRWHEERPAVAALRFGAAGMGGRDADPVVTA